MKKRGAMPSGYLKRNKNVSRRRAEGNGSRNTHKSKSWRRCWDRERPPHKVNHMAEDTAVNLIEAPKEPPPDPRYISNGTCYVCLASSADVLDLGHCGHTACLLCLRDYYTAREIERFPTRCPLCEKRVPMQDLIRDGVLETSVEVQRSLKLKNMAWRLKHADKASMHDQVECAHCGRPQRGAYKNKRKTRDLVCTHCYKVFTVPGYKQPHTIPPDILAAVDFGIDLCPKCGNGIELNGGCRTVTCLCGTTFVWTDPELREDMRVHEEARIRKEISGQITKIK